MMATNNNINVNELVTFIENIEDSNKEMSDSGVLSNEKINSLTNVKGNDETQLKEKEAIYIKMFENLEKYQKQLETILKMEEDGLIIGEENEKIIQDFKDNLGHKAILLQNVFKEIEEEKAKHKKMFYQFIKSFKEHGFSESKGLENAAEALEVGNMAIFFKQATETLKTMYQDMEQALDNFKKNKEQKERETDWEDTKLKTKELFLTLIGALAEATTDNEKDREDKEKELVEELGITASDSELKGKTVEEAKKILEERQGKDKEKVNEKNNIQTDTGFDMEVSSGVTNG